MGYVALVLHGHMLYGIRCLVYDVWFMMYGLKVCCFKGKTPWP